VLIVLFVLLQLHSLSVVAISVRVSNLTLGTTALNLIDSNTEDIYRVVYNSTNTTLNVTAWTNATSDLPLLIVIRQEKGLISLQLPNKDTSKFIQNVSRILCPAFVGRDKNTGLSTVYIDIYTSSQSNISYSLHVAYFDTFVISEKTTTNIFVAPFAPVFFKYDMRYESSIVKFTSRDRICTTVSVQRMACPVFDLKHTVDFAGQYQTMTQLGAISVDNPGLRHKSMYIVISVHPNDKDCCDSVNCSGSSGYRIKNMTIQLLQGYDNSTVNLNYAITLSVFLAIYIIICPFLCFVEPYCEKNFKILIDELKTIQTTYTSLTPTSTNHKMFELLNEQRKHHRGGNNIASTSSSPSIRPAHYRHIITGSPTPTSQSGGDTTPVSTKPFNLNECLAKNVLLSRFLKMKPIITSPIVMPTINSGVDLSTPTTSGSSQQQASLNNTVSSTTTSSTIDAHYDKANLSIQIPKIQISESKMLSGNPRRSNKVRRNNRNDLIYSPHMATSLTKFNNDNNNSHVDLEAANDNGGGLVSMTPSNVSYSTSVPIEDSSLITEDNSFTSSEYDRMEDADSYKQVVRNKPNLKVHDLARKQAKILDRKIMNYPRLIIAIATFYVLPVIQLILLYQTQLTKSGNEDSCYFNFLCMIKSGPFAAFNNVFSNVGYVLLGIMFIIVVKKRSYSYTYMRKKYPMIMSNHGIPQHFGLFYTMGIGLIMEGILSAAYHVCPSFNNFQFDTSFMYIVGVITTIKLYQCRHPDIHPSSQKVFLFLALCILLNVVGVFYGKDHMWFVFSYTIGHLVFFFCLSVVIYYMKQPKFGISALKLVAQQLKKDKNLSQPVHFDRLIMLVIANVFNISIAVNGILFPTQFSSYLLNVLLGNFMLYFLMYLVNKIIHKEKFHMITIVNLAIATLSWIIGLYLYKIEIKQWEKSPAQSREANKSCILLNVYDHHDAWHLLSSLSMFMSFVVILTLDDGIVTKRRTEIAVF